MAVENTMNIGASMLSEVSERVSTSYTIAMLHTALDPTREELVGATHVSVLGCSTKVPHVDAGFKVHATSKGGETAPVPRLNHQLAAVYSRKLGAGDLN